MQKFEDNMLIINVSDNKANYSQRNNAYVHKNDKGKVDVSGSSMCNVTSMCQALDYNGWKFPSLGKFSQPEDALADFIMKSPEVDKFYSEKMPGLYADYRAMKTDSKGRPSYFTPNEVHACLAFGTNLWLGCTKAVQFYDCADVWSIINELIEGRAVVVSGVFAGLNHIVTLVGARWNFNDTSNMGLKQTIDKIVKNKSMPTSVIIDDPYGNFRNGYKAGYSGNDIILNIKEFYSMLKPLNKVNVKYAHFIKSGAATV